jgi:hypothetical protein
MKNGPFLVGLPLHVQNPTFVGLKRPPNPIVYDLVSELK